MDHSENFVVMRAFAFLTVLLVISGCPHPTPTPVTPPDGPVGVIDCVLEPAGLPTTEDVCDNMFTTDGYACARCPGGGGCRDTVDMIYCVVGTCLSDKRCVASASINLDEGVVAAKHRIRKRRK